MSARDDASEPRGVRIVVSGVVDRETAGTVADAVRQGLETAPRVEVDIRAVDRWEDDSLRDLAACTLLGDGVEFLVEGRRSSRSR
jgi:hypothetical protein